MAKWSKAPYSRSLLLTPEQESRENSGPYMRAGVRIPFLTNIFSSILMLVSMPLSSKHQKCLVSYQVEKPVWSPSSDGKVFNSTSFSFYHFMNVEYGTFHLQYLSGSPVLFHLIFSVPPKPFLFLSLFLFLYHTVVLVPLAQFLSFPHFLSTKLN